MLLGQIFLGENTLAFQQLGTIPHASSLSAIKNRGAHRSWHILLYLIFLAAITGALPNLSGQTMTGTGGYVPNAIAPGNPSSSYAINNIFSINYFTGNLNLHIPLLKMSARGEAGTTITFTGDWARQIIDQYESSDLCPTQGVNCHVYGEAGIGVAGLPIIFGGVTTQAGWMVVTYSDNVQYGVHSDAYALSRLYFYQSDGTATELVDMTYYASRYSRNAMFTKVRRTHPVII